MDRPLSVAVAYHAATKHYFNRFARSLGYLDWATQPDPFRLFAGAPRRELAHGALAADVSYSALFDGSAPARPITEHAIGEFLRCSMGLSAWKRHGSSRWALRVNPSSGNLHPTETYIVRGAEVCHYDVRAHALEQRCTFAGTALPDDGLLVALTSIHWREAWKYGERAFRYCQHDAGHAIGTLRIAAALLGWRLELLPQWTHAQMAALLGADRDDDFGEAEREEPECIAVVTPGATQPWRLWDPAALVAAVRDGRWTGRANRLSRSQVEWTLIDEVARATRVGPESMPVGPESLAVRPEPATVGPGTTPVGPESNVVGPASARDIILKRRSAVAFDARSSLPVEDFLAMLSRLDPARLPFDAVWWKPHVHLALFIHRVDGLTPGVYAYVRDEAGLEEWRTAMRSDFLWERVAPSAGLHLLVPIDARAAGNRVSCDQDMAADGFFSLGMVARFEAALAERGDPFYRQLFWEAGLIGQVLYLEAEAHGARATGIGCYYDEPVHELLGLEGQAWQSLYHFCVGIPVDDARLTTEPGYAWER